MYLSFILLTLAISLRWLPGQHRFSVAGYAWLCIFSVALGVALYKGQLEIIALLPIVLFGLACCFFERLAGVWRLAMGLAIVLLSLGFGLHVFAGFHNPLIVDHVQLAQDSLAYSLRFNFDKPLIGLFILGCLHPLVGNRHDVLLMLRQLLPVAVITLGLVVLFSFVLDYIRLDFKIPDFLLFWLWANLFFTCVAEEALFRGFLQRQLGKLLSNVKQGAVLALVVCAVLFGIAHGQVVGNMSCWPLLPVWGMAGPIIAHNVSKPVSCCTLALTVCILFSLAIQRLRSRQWIQNLVFILV